MRLKNNNSGFSLLSLLLTILIIGILFMVFMKKNTKEVVDNETHKMKRQFKAIAKAKAADRIIKINTIKLAIQQFELDKGKLPDSLQELLDKKYIHKGDVIDANKKPINYDASSGKVY